MTFHPAVISGASGRDPSSTPVTIFIASEDVLDQKILFGRLRSLMTNPE